MTRDPVVEEVRSARQKIFEECKEDVDAFLDCYQEQEQLDRERLVSDLSKQPEHDTKLSTGPTPKNLREVTSGE